MAESDISGEIGGGIQLTCILDEGSPTVGARTYGPGGTYEKGLTWGSELYKGEPVTLSDASENTYAACNGMPVVEQVSDDDDKVIGMIVSEPRLVKFPADTTAGDSWTKQLEGQYYRVATVEIWGGITAIRAAHLIRADAIAVTPGVLTILDVDVSQVTTDHDLVLNDVSENGAGFMPFHYVAKGAVASYTILVGIVALGTAET